MSRSNDYLEGYDDGFMGRNNRKKSVEDFNKILFPNRKPKPTPDKSKSLIDGIARMEYDIGHRDGKRDREYEAIRKIIQRD